MASVEAVARENGAVIEAMGPAGVAVFPQDDAHAPLWRELAGPRPVLSFALQGSADVTGGAAWEGDRWAVRMRTPAGEATVSLRVAGLHNVKNALAATACALAAGCPLVAVAHGLESFEPVKGRSQVSTLHWQGQQATLIDDTYNANPDSVRAAVDVLAALPSPRWLLLGDMGEVGDRGPAFHAEVGAYARQRSIDVLWTAGDASADTARAFGAARQFASAAAMADAVPQGPQAAAVLVKGSRFMKMEQVVAALRAHATAPQPGPGSQQQQEGTA
jgi:UDP-N-acetylmuramoyl-tripeptide--D-alanyl-D-alanine ligase